MKKKIVILENSKDMYEGEYTGKVKYTARFKNNYSDIKGCPLGRSTVSFYEAIKDLIYRTNFESKLSLKESDFKIINGYREVYQDDGLSPYDFYDIPVEHCESCGKEINKNCSGTSDISLCADCFLSANNKELQHYVDMVEQLAKTTDGKTWLLKCVNNPSDSMRQIHIDIINSILTR
jgi:hypothetical protein